VILKEVENWVAKEDEVKEVFYDDEEKDEAMPNPKSFSDMDLPAAFEFDAAYQDAHSTLWSFACSHIIVFLLYLCFLTIISNRILFNFYIVLIMADCDDFICKNDSKEPLIIGGVPQQPAVNRLPVKESPLNIAEIGHSTWPLLHRMSLSYPDKPSDHVKEIMRKTIYGFSNVYPCKHCAADFRLKIAVEPPQLDSRKDFALWLCE